MAGIFTSGDHFINSFQPIYFKYLILPKFSTRKEAYWKQHSHQGMETESQRKNYLFILCKYIFVNTYLKFYSTFLLISSKVEEDRQNKDKMEIPEWWIGLGGRKRKIRG